MCTHAFTPFAENPIKTKIFETLKPNGPLNNVKHPSYSYQLLETLSVLENDY